MANGIAAAKAFIGSIFGYTIEDDNVVYQALDTTGYGVPEGNKRIAKLGDMVLDAAIVDT